MLEQASRMKVEMLLEEWKLYMEFQLTWTKVELVQSEVKLIKLQSL